MFNEIPALLGALLPQENQEAANTTKVWQVVLTLLQGGANVWWTALTLLQGGVKIWWAQGRGLHR